MAHRLIANSALGVIFAAAISTASTGDYIEVNGLRIYFETHGTGKPLVLLHGAFGTAESWSRILPALTKSRKVIIVEQQGHGHTADRDAPLSYEQMADDTAALLRKIGTKGVDVFGYSDGGVVGLALAIRHSDLVGRLAILGANAGSMEATYERQTFEQFLNLPDDFAPAVLKDPYDRVAPDKSRWPVLVRKIKDLGRKFSGFREEQLRSIKAPTLIMQGDRDGVKPEHAVAMMRMIPRSQLAIFPDGDHFILFTRAAMVVQTFMTFFDDRPKGQR